MSKIKKLDSSIYNKIAAGEVVERPSSVVKELVENAIDASATIISVFISEGGLAEITVSDNGSGIEKEDLPTAFLPHATSKIDKADDLYTIASLGFRGEALASIASVSHTKIKSRCISEESGNMLAINAGSVDDLAPCGMAQGTTISVNDLFYNTPARLKFLKKPRYEENEIVSLMTKFILANPRIGFELSNEQGSIIKSDGRSLYDAIQNVFDNEVVDNLLPINNIRGSLSISGYISNTTFSKSNRTYQTIILNGRIINNVTVATAINNAYSHYLMKRCYPVIVVNITMPLDEVDVNVHPAKTDVRFADNNKIFGFVFSTVRDALEKYEKDRALSFITSQATAQEVSSDIADIDNIAKNNVPNSLSNIYPKESIFDSISNVFKSVAEDSGIQTKIRSIIQQNQITDSIVENSNDSNDKYQEKEVGADEVNLIEDFGIQADYRIIGQVFGTYIIIEHNEELLLVDQHAASERVLYERLLEEYNSGEIAIQPMLVPYIFTVNAAESSIINEKLNMLFDIGIDIEEFGNNTFKISALPLALIDINFEKLIGYLLGDNKNTTDDAIREKLIYSACRSAIKGNTNLANEGIKLLINNLFTKEIPLKCPHGRPTYIKLGKNELAKMFKRIL